MKINNDYWQSLLSVTKVSTETGKPENRSGTLQSLAPGQQVKGEVLARLSEQVYLVKIAGDIYRTELPEPVRPGSQLTLTFRTSEPRPEFSLKSIQSDASPVRLSSTVASLSEALKAPSAPTLQGVKSLEPLLTALPVDSTVLASSLRNALSMSGLFYESHLVQWSLGERRLEDIQKESRLRLSSMAKDIKKSADGKISQDPDNLMEDIKNILTTEQGDELQRPQKSIAALSDHVPASLLREQVENLLTGIFRWQGHVWLDQEMEWEVEKHPGERDQESAQSWRTTIRLTLPNLGEVSATLVSSDEGITGRITTDSMESKNVLKQEVSLLEERMAASGLNLTSMIIEHRDGR